MNHLLIDFENIQPLNLDKLDDANTHIWLFLGANQQKSIPLVLCQSLCRFGQKVHFVRVKKTGKNALDFYLSFYLGKITEQDPSALIGILSKDGGYDILIEHIQANGLANGIVRLSSLDEVQRLPDSPSNEDDPKPLPAAKQDDEAVQTASSHAYSPRDFGVVLTTLRQADAFLPRLYGNLVKRIHNVILADQWANHTPELRQEKAERLAATLLRKGLIEQGADGLLSYRLDAEFILERVQARALQSQARTVEKLSNVIRASLTGFGIEGTETDIRRFIDSLVVKKLILIQNGNITYAPFGLPEKPDTLQLENYQPAQPVWQKVLALLKMKNRPAKVQGLHNMLKTQGKQLGLTEGEIARLIDYLQAKKHILVKDANGKIQYLK